MTEIKLTRRYPQSRTEDIVDAYMRGWNDALDAVQNGKFHIAEQTEPQIDGAIDEARFKAHCMNCQRDVADIKCLDCDGDKYFIPDEPQTDCAWR